jgi:hypothetical protein
MRKIEGGGRALGFGGGSVGHGLGFRERGARKRWRWGLKRSREAALACGPSRGAARGVAWLEPELGSGSVRPEVGDDRWPPPVGDRGRGCGPQLRWAAVGLEGRLG